MRDKQDQLEVKLRQAETDKASLGAKEQSLRENLAQVVKDKEQAETESRERLGQEKKEAQRQIEEAKSQVNQSEENSKEMRR